MMSEDRKDYEENKESYYSRLPDGIIPVSEYIAWKKPITVYCEKCGRTHTYSEAKYAVKRKCHGCYLKEIRKESTVKLLEILEKCDFTLVDWPGDSKVATIKCNKCGAILSRTVEDVNTHGYTVCQNCRKIETSKKPKTYYRHGLSEEQRKAKETVRKRRMQTELDELLTDYIEDYDVVSIDDNFRDLVLRHKKCGHEFATTKDHLKKNHGCKICSKRGASKAVQDIEKYLDANGIEYEREKRFDDCRRKNPLPFDFFIPSKNLLIEYNGEQHYRATEYFGGKEKIKLYWERDRIKRQFAETHGYRLLIIVWKQDPVAMVASELN